MELKKKDESTKIETLITQIEGKATLSGKRFLEESLEMKKIREIQNLDYFPGLMSGLLLKAQVLLGLKQGLDQMVVKDITACVLRIARDMSMPDLAKAFANARYGIYGQKIEHFGAFNTAYVVEVLKFYKAWKTQQMTSFNIPIFKETRDFEAEAKEHEKRLLGTNLSVYETLIVKGEPCPFAHSYFDVVFPKMVRFKMVKMRADRGATDAVCHRVFGLFLASYKACLSFDNFDFLPKESDEVLSWCEVLLTDFKEKYSVYEKNFSLKNSAEQTSIQKALKVLANENQTDSMRTWVCFQNEIVSEWLKRFKNKDAFLEQLNNREG